MIFQECVIRWIGEIGARVDEGRIFRYFAE